MKKIKKIIYILIIVFFMISIVPKRMQNDTFFTIAGGREILKNGIEAEEKLVWHEGLKFTNSRWLFDILITIIYNYYNFEGIYLFVIIISVIQGLLYYYVMQKITGKNKFSFFITIISMYELKLAFTARAQIISNLLLLIEFFCLEKLSKEDIKRKYVIILCCIPILFANIHSSTFPIYLIVFLPYIAEYILGKISILKINQSKFICEVKNIKILIVLFLIGILSGFFTPVFTSAYTDMFKVTSGMSFDFILELNKMTIFDNMYLSGIIIMTISILSFSNQKIRISDGLFILGFCLLAMDGIRNLYYVILISSICIARIYIEFLDSFNFNINFSNKYIKILESIALLIIFLFASNIFIKNQTQEYIEYSDYPVKAVKFIKNNLNMNDNRIFNHFNFGSYLEFEGIKAFIDSRSGIYTEEFNPGCTILKDWRAVASLNDDYNSVFDKYEIDYLLLYVNEPVAKCIKFDSKWRYIYQDNSFILYERVAKK